MPDPSLTDVARPLDDEREAPRSGRLAYGCVEDLLPEPTRVGARATKLFVATAR